jgi:virginiamycin B lyase
LTDNKSRNRSPNKKIAIYAIIGAITVTAVSALLITGDKPSENMSTSDIPQVEESKQQSIQRFQNQFCGITSQPNSNAYVTEIRLPGKCEMPLALVVDTNENKVWYLSTKNGSLGSYNYREQIFEKEHIIPQWPSRQNPIESSQVWTMKIDQNRNIWFTDEKQNSLWRYEPLSESFQIYKIPATSESFGSIYPVSLDFDSNGNIYLVGIRSPSLWFGNTTEMANNTSKGISEIPLPLQGFDGIDRDLISTGSIATDNKDNAVWITLLAFGHKGQIMRYDTANQTFDIFDLPHRLSSPVGIALEDSRILWVTDHGTSIFFNFLPNDRNVTEFVTSKPSDRIFGGTGSFSSQAYTLPYWIHKADDGTLWFNEHTGNKIAHFLPSNNTLIEYWIPSQNKLYSPCDPQSVNVCGIANALQLSVGSRNVSDVSMNISRAEGSRSDEVWFTEWSENKIGRIDSSQNLPFSVHASPQEITIKKGDIASIDVLITPSPSPSPDRVNMTASSTFTPTGNFGNSSWSFSKESFFLEKGKTETVKFVTNPSTDLAAGRYILMLGAEDSKVTYLKAIPINII